MSQRFSLLCRRIGTILSRRLARLLFRLPRSRQRTAQRGFVLPTTIMMLLVVMLTVSALVYRAYSHTAQVIGEAQQRVVYNAATPAIDRARAKLETLFDANRDTRYPGGVPAEAVLAGMLRNDGSYSVTALATDIYTLPGETRINLDGQTKAGEVRGEDNAWAYRVDTNGDGTNDATVVYSIILQTPPDASTPATPSSPAQPVVGSGIVSTSDRTKAQNLWVRTAPLSNRQRGNCGTSNTQAASAAQGWFQDLNNSATLRKNLQIDAIVIPDTARNRPSYVTLELQQDRQLDRGNKWGAWFRNDLEIFPGADFNWNGAMHTEGNLVINPGGSFTAYLVSAQNSCLMSVPNSSEITVTNIENPTNAAKLKPDFIGGTLSASIRDNSYGGSSNIHVWPATATGASAVATLDPTTQSANQAGTPIAMSLNPVTLLTRDVSEARGANTSNRSNVTTTWQGLPANSRNPRITNQAEPKPYVDDLYRADDRWGPKPRYTDQIVLRGAAQQPGNPITAGNVTAAGDLNTLTGNTAPVDNPAAVGLDGYWERRAMNEGMRVIVGQRLELGNNFNWGGVNDPLYPPNANISHEQRQRRTLRDNLAAVQASAIYHANNPNGGGLMPAACLASTSHPGTLATLQNSIRFTEQTINGSPSPKIITDFFMGNGTNGWEFNPPVSATATETTFANAITSTQPLGKALRNLAYFAGDPEGGFPATPSSVSGRIRPDPTLTAWGNFSELRRTLARLDGGVAYINLSPADKTNLHTAACTLGMLAYNIENRKYDFAANEGNGSTPGLAMLGTKLFDLIDGRRNNGEVRNPANGQYYSFTVQNGNPSSAYYTNAPATYSALPAEAFLNALATEPIPGLSQNDRNDLSAIIRNTSEMQQIDRDRVFGFKSGVVNPPPPATSSGFWASNNFRYQARVVSTNLLFTTRCDPEIFPLNNSGNQVAQRNQRVALALALCSPSSSKSEPRYPALFYLFPKENHDYDGDASAKTSINNDQGNEQPPAEPYIVSHGQIGATSGVPGSTPFNVVGSSADDFSGVLISPKASNFSDWVLPNAAPQNVANANVSPNLIVAPGGTRAVGFLDRAIFNGREMMTSRVMDIDLGMLRSVNIAAGRPWLPVSGIVYAFREDAVREDAIARPASGTQTNATTLPGSDPAQVTTTEGIRMSVKPVDYIADPDRRPHGFRLRNGSQVKRNNALGVPATDNIRGLSFISDDVVYIQGDFNRHQTGNDNTAGSRLEEFTEQMNGDYNQFYRRSTRDQNFARAASDRWRPSEILADAIYILSDTFCDGSLQDTFITPTATNYHSPSTGIWGPGCTGDDTSFTNQNRPTTLNSTWMRESGSTASTDTTPIEIDRNGAPLISGGSYSGTYQGLGDSKSGQWMAAANTQVNAILVNGIVPSRANQSYGGLHNFPRMLEDWNGRTLQINGAFLQLNFSNYGTGPYDQDSWEPGSTPAGSESLQYYWPPTRQWGYDPALQLAPAGPAAARFITANQNRNEFYTELPVSDAFMNQLCTAFNAAPKSGTLAQAPATVPCL